MFHPLPQCPTGGTMEEGIFYFMLCYAMLCYAMCTRCYILEGICYIIAYGNLFILLYIYFNFVHLSKKLAK